MIEFENFLSPGRKGHLIGIGGVSMSSLGEVLHGMGISTGIDLPALAATGRWLAERLGRETGSRVGRAMTAGGD